jgi:hypothetical protein
MRIIPILVAVCLVTVPTQAKYGGGSGAADDPYQIATAEDLILLGESPEDYDKHFILTADIDLAGHVFDKAVIAPDTDPNDQYSSFHGASFTGAFDGNDHTISHLTITGGGYLGLFGQLASSARVRDVGVVNVKVSGSAHYVGGLAGESGGQVTQCHSTGAVRGTYDLGGLVGKNYGAVTRSWSTGSVTGTPPWSGDIGGLAGENGGRIAQCYSTSAVSGGSPAGGLLGWNYRGTVSQCYSTGPVSSYGGGLVGTNYATVVYSVWDMETSGLARSDGGVGLTKAEMMDARMLGLNGFANDPNWVLDDGRDYPRLAWEGTPGVVIPEPKIDWLEGLGTAETPYRIDTAEQLILLGRAGALWDSHFVVGADIDLDPGLPGRCVFTQAVIPAFTGVFDGNDHTISHLTVTGGESVGLFGRLESGAQVKNLGVTDVNIVGSSAGALAGWNVGAVVTHCYSTGVVKGNYYIGGLVGSNWAPGTVTWCHSTAAASGFEYVGGLTGEYIGGLIGRNTGSVLNCYATGKVTGRGYAGGLLGDNSGNATQCYSTSAVSGSNFVGGLVGSNYSGDVTSCYSNGRVTGKNFVGGLAGYNYDGSITTSYSTGAVSGSNFVGGLVQTGWPGGVVTASFWDVQASGQATSDGGTGLTTAQMQTASTFLIWGTCESEGVWTIDEGKDYPRLRWENRSGEVIQPIRLSDFLTGAGTKDDPYMIYTAQDISLMALVVCDLDKHFKVMADIDMSGFDGKEGRPAFNIIASDLDTVKSGFQGTPFTGVFDGNGHTISHLTINGAGYLGLFGHMSGEVKDLGVVDVNIAGSGYYVGGLVGYNSGSVMRCYTTGLVAGRSYVGGLVGHSNGVIDNCYSLASANGDNYVGGLAGRSYGRITNCYSTGTVAGNDHFGGLLGYGGGSVSASFWDTQTSGQATSASGTGKTTGEMQMASTFLGWGCSPVVWTIDEGIDYPRIAWEGKPGKPLPSLADFVAGFGSQAEPYLICTGDELNIIGSFPSEWDKHFNLMADIDLSEYRGTSFKMIGLADNPFAGVFDGNDHTISNFSYSCSQTYNIGLFGYVSGPNSVIKNLKLTWADIDAGAGGVVGALVGYLEGGTIADCYIDGGSVSGGWEVGGLVGTSYQGTLTDCKSTATVSGNGSVGGLVGRNGWQSVMTQCSSTGTVSGGSSVGGLVGSNQGTITYCDSAGRVLGDWSVGGLVGTSGCSEDWWWCEEPGTISDSYSTAGVLGTSSNCGGLVGSNDAGEVARCYASGIVLGVSTVGGLAGWNGGNISSCYSTADVGGEKDVGGLVGLNSGGWLSPEAAIANCYSTGIVLGDEYVGGLVGDGDANDVVASMWDIETSGQGMSAGGTGKTTAEMQMASTFVNAGLPAAVGWDFVGETANGAEDIWAICEGVDYPRLAWEFVTGDFDADADTDFADFCILAEHWLSADGSFWCRRRSEAMATERGLGCDLTNDGSVNWQDLMVFAENWLR